MTWISASATRNHLLGNALIDWLATHGRANGFTRDTDLPGYDKRLDFALFIMNKGNTFEIAVAKHLASLADTLKIAQSPSDIRDLGAASETLAALKNGQPIVHQGVLHDDQSETYGAPDLLIRSDVLNQLIPGALTPEETAIPAPGLGVNPWHYVIVDIKFTTLQFLATGLLSNSGSSRAYKGQLFVYNRALGVAQGYIPPRAFLLGRGWEQRTVGRRGNNAMERLGPVPMDDLLRKNVEAAVEWMRSVKTEGAGWEVLPKPTIDELWPNMGSTSDFPWQDAKARIAHELGEITLLWQVGVKGRGHAHRQGITNWHTPGLVASVLGISSLSTASVLDALLEINQSTAGPPVQPTHVSASEDEWRAVPTLEFYVDFETVSTLGDDFSDFPKQSGAPLIFMIGCGHVKGGVWTFRSFTAEALTEAEEARIVNEWLSHMAALESLFDDHINPRIIHWSPAEVTNFETAYNSARDRHPENHWPNLSWFDLLARVIRKEPVVVRGSLGFGLKPFAKALHAHGLVETSWGDSQLDGLGAMVGAWSAAKEATAKNTGLSGTTLMQEIARYNKVDCQIMMEIVRYLRSNH